MHFVTCSMSRNRKKKLFLQLLRKSSSQPRCEPGLSSRAGPPTVSVTAIWCGPGPLILAGIYFNNSVGARCAGIRGGGGARGDVMVHVCEGRVTAALLKALLGRTEPTRWLKATTSEGSIKLQCLFTHDSSQPPLMVLIYYPSAVLPFLHNSPPHPSFTHLLSPNWPTKGAQWDHISHKPQEHLNKHTHTHTHWSH